MDLKLPPPLVAFICAVIIYFLPNYAEPNWVYRCLAVICFAFGIAVDLCALWAFWQNKTTITPLDPHKTSSLATNGIYRFSRNPMYLGLASLLTAWAFWWGNAFALLVVWGFVGYINRFQIEPEERILSEKFGERYRQYQQQVPRWLW
ncbi:MULTISPECIES: isoprenylcysteine carboxylmethyltransferase family protein [Glaesserella]|uniref:Isoprenylcysteine carboxylmethyltransferase family protein n=1 Tax=Glaesserella australis TaxID=2094024 RepID=A0A328BYE9_9PAST|nr:MULTISPECIES: isoprenylcysteine carboxylmethyltransferase family protein [Glaesserella]AUI66388.1 protein-S-isoprenylcysteine methyltransferase [Glaesserella sp. 15-184]RAL19398.1 isoprenylcysteine carboxylmethyltransferase family protein [Glaesserella australis]